MSLPIVKVVWFCRFSLTGVGFLLSGSFKTAVFLVAGLVCAMDVTTATGHEIARELHDGFQLFIKSLEPQQVEELKFEFEDGFRKDWQFVPMDRRGLAFGDMETSQRLLAMSLLQTALSHRGFTQSVQVMALEQVLHELENQNPIRNPNKYHLFLFGDPSTSESWGWRVEGHHLSLNFTIVGGENVVATPAFFGTNPAKVLEGPMRGMRVLGLQEDLARSLVQSFTDDQKKSAIIAVKAPRDVINGPGREARVLKPMGLAFAAMNAEQQSLVMQIVQRYTGRLRNELATQDMDRIRAAGVENIHFSWAGSTQAGRPHYYAIQGPTFVMEYDNCLLYTSDAADE